MTEPQRKARTYAGRAEADRRAERRERLMDAGLAAFGGEGYAATSIGKLCTAASVSTKHFYQEFDGREALLMALHDRVIERAMAAVGEALEGHDEAAYAERLAAAVRAYIGAVAADPRWARLAYVEVVGISAAVERHRYERRQRWVDFLVAEGERAVRRGEAVRRDFRISAVALIGAVNELVYHWSIGGYRAREQPPSLEDVIIEVLRLVTTMLQPPGLGVPAGEAGTGAGAAAQPGMAR